MALAVGGASEKMRTASGMEGEPWGLQGFEPIGVGEGEFNNYGMLSGHGKGVTAKNDGGGSGRRPNKWLRLSFCPVT